MFDYFISDTHFGHKGIISLCYRPFNDVEDMEETLIRNFNEKVKRHDSSILWLGDVFFCNKAKSIDILSQLKGRHSIVLGNHDSSPTKMMDIGFEMVVPDQMYFKIGPRFTFRACHFPYFSKHEEDLRFPELRPHKRGEDFLLHGHTHSMCKSSGTMIHCGVDAWDFTPISDDEILQVAHKIKGI